MLTPLKNNHFAELAPGRARIERVPGARLRLDAARVQLREGRYMSALAEIDAAASAGSALRREGLLLRGRALFGLKDFRGSLTAYESLTLLGRKQPRLDGARGLVLFELGHLPEARRALGCGLRAFPNWARVHHTLGLIDEIEERPSAAWRFRRARQLDPKRFPAVMRLSAEAFETALRAALKKAPPSVLAFAAHLPIVVALSPRVHDFARRPAQLRPSALGRLAWAALEGDMPTQVLMLYRRNIERSAARKQIEVAEQLRLFTEQILTRPLPQREPLLSVKSSPRPRLS